MAYPDDDHSTISRKNVELSSRSMSMTVPLNASYESEAAFVSHTGPLYSHKPAQFSPFSGPLHGSQTPGHASFNKYERHHSKSNAIMPEEMNGRYWLDGSDAQRNEHLWKSGPLAVCNNVDCIDCPAAYKTRKGYYRTSGSLETKLHNIFYEDTEGWSRRSIAFLNSYFPIMNPHTKVVQQWNKFFVISCLVAIFVDPLFFFLLSARQEQKCIVFNWSLATAITVVRSATDLIYFLHMLLQFRLAYVAPESRVVGAGDLVDQPKKIAMHYLRGYFLLDLFVVLPLPQVMILVVIPKYVGTSSANYAKNLLRFTVLLQYIPRIIRFLPLLAGQSASGFIFESAWANFVIHLLMFVLAGHVVGSCWYLFGLQRVNQCLRNACFDSKKPSCLPFIDCGSGHFDENNDSHSDWSDWQNNLNASACFSKNGAFQYGIYVQAVNLITEHSVVTRYFYSLFWGFQQISTLAGNQVPSYFIWEVLFTMAIGGLGLLLFAELPPRAWKKFRIFSLMDEPVLDAIFEKLGHTFYIRGSDILYQGGPIDKMVFIVRGKLENIGADGNVAPLSEGDVCGEELLTWCLEHSANKAVGKVRFGGQRFSSRTVWCLTNVEAFSLRAADLK